MAYLVTTAVDYVSRTVSKRHATQAEVTRAERECMGEALYPVAFWCRFCRVTLEAGRHG